MLGDIGKISNASLLRYFHALSLFRLSVMGTPRSGGSQYWKTMVVTTLYHGAHSTTKRLSSKRHIYPIKFHPKIDLVSPMWAVAILDVVITKLCTMCDLTGWRSLCLSFRYQSRCGTTCARWLRLTIILENQNVASSREF
jgi:hypothetical protein